jgi:hypothetical protein
MMQAAELTPPPVPLPPDAFVVPGPSSPTAIWRAAIAQRRELTSQLEQLQDRRGSLSERLKDGALDGVDRKGLESQISDVDGQISVVQRSLAAANDRVASTAAIPGAVVETPPPSQSGPPQEVYVLSGMFMVIVLLPLSIALARRVWRRSAAAVAALPHELMDRLARLDQAVDSIAVEVERIGEGQRFVTRLMGERPAPDPLPRERSAGS